MTVSGLYVCGRCFTEADHSYYLGQTTVYGVCSRCGGQASMMVDAAVSEPHPNRADSEMSFSTSEALLPSPLFVWDVNAYYRDLGVPSWATRKEIKARYQEIDGQSSERLTYIVKVLLDAEKRKAYDSCPLGTKYFDYYYDRMAKEILEQEASASRAAGEEFETEPIDFSDAIGKPVSVAPERASNRRDPRPTQWGHFLWSSTCNDTDRLAEWRSSLTGAFSSKGDVRSLSVGFHAGREDSWVAHPVGEALVVFLHEDEKPTTELAAQVADHLIGA